MLKLRSNPRNVDHIQPFLESVANQYRISPDTFDNMLVSLTEAVSNAIRHGNCLDETKTVEVKLRQEKGCLSIQVSDEGCGFDFQNLPDPTSPENLCKPGGRGVFLMRALSDDITYFNNGSTVKMSFRLERD